MAPGNLNGAEPPYVSSEQEFSAICKLPKAVIYIQIDGSEPEQQSREVFHHALKTIDNTQLPVFMINVSGHQLEYFENWLITQDEHVHLFYTGGYGEIVFMQNGVVTDFLNFPGKAGVDTTVAKLQQWLQQA